MLKTVTLDEINKGDIVICKAGEKAAVDGKIVNCKAHFDESFITGESKPVAKEKNSNVLAGSLNYDGYIEYEAEKIGKESTVSEIVKIVVEASNTKTPRAKVADKVSGYYVPVVILIAIITFNVYLIIGKNVETAITTFVTVLVVACPCSLGLATPLAIVASEGLCASNGILVKKSEILEKAQKVDTVVFDKTGTLTYGKLKISEVVNYCNIENDKLLQIVGSVENKSTHPIAEAFISYLQEKNIKFLNVDNFENIAGMGVTAEINNEKIIIGNAKILDKFNIINNYVQDEERLSEHGNSIIYVAKENEIIALVGVNDIVKEEARDLIKTLKARKIQTIMLTGDNQKTADIIARELGIEKVISEVLPTEKVDMIRNLKKENRFVMMCGDGINDSPALASSDIGVSVNNSTDIAMDSSDVILTRSDLKGILDLMKISKATIRNIKQNLFWAFFYNCLMIPIAIGLLRPFGITINPMIASLAMVISSITVILNALRLRRM